MNRFERLHKMDDERFAEAVVAVINEMPYCTNENCPYLSADGFVCRSSDSKKHCPQAIMNYLSKEVDDTVVPEKNGSVVLAIVVGIVAAAVMAVALLTR